MFVISVKSSKLKSVVAIALIAIFATIGGLYFVSRSNNKPVAKANGIVYKASTAEERIAFFSQFGWEINEDPAEVKEVIIPEEFDNVYQNYNQLQNKQKLDLEKYKGARVKCWTYDIMNYPDYENCKGIIRGNILVFDGIVIGGDISSVELGGFMHTFERPDAIG